MHTGVFERGATKQSAKSSGLQYKILSDADGKKATAGDTVEVRYRGTLLDGTQFESTYNDGHSATIVVSDPHVIAGLREALKLREISPELCERVVSGDSLANYPWRVSRPICGMRD